MIRVLRAPKIEVIIGQRPGGKFVKYIRLRIEYGQVLISQPGKIPSLHKHLQLLYLLTCLTTNTGMAGAAASSHCS
jgi:hypothetical protein